MRWAKTLAGVGTLALAAGASTGLAGCVHLGGGAKGPPAPKPVPVCASMDRVNLIAASAPGRTPLTGAAGASVTLLPACGPPFLAQRIKNSAGDRFILVIDDLRPQSSGGAAYGVGFAQALGTGLTNEASIVGALTLEPGAGKAAPRNLRFDVTKTIQAMVEANHLENLVVTLKSTPPAGGTALTAARMQILSE